VDAVRAKLRRIVWNGVALTAVFLTIGLLASVWIARSFVRPIAQLSRVATSIARGEMDAPIERQGSVELASLADSIARMRDEIRKTIAALQVEIRERQAAERELQNHRNHLEEMVERRTAELVRSNKDLEQFAYVASHDLQEPLRKISAFGDMLAADEGPRLSQQGRDYVAIMKDAAVRMQRLINDLLIYSRVAACGGSVQCVDLNEVVREVVSELAARIKETDAQVDVGELPSVEANRTQMGQLFHNLIGNGLKFRKESERPVVRVYDEASTLERLVEGSGGAVIPDGHCRIVIEDNGIGFDEKYSDRIFRIFQRLHSRVLYDGSGIGLAICRRIVEHHGGSITARSSPGVGSAFTVVLPLRRSGPSPMAANSITGATV
jgi:light-regulated signal transduction histidine kinase (bacteriophytochrome)/HAMP domain-containing protein